MGNKSSNDSELSIDKDLPQNLVHADGTGLGNTDATYYASADTLLVYYCCWPCIPVIMQ